MTQPFELLSQPVDSLTRGHVDLEKDLSSSPVDSLTCGHVDLKKDLSSSLVDSWTRGHVDLKKTPVFFSLGNFVFDQTPPPTRRALMAELVITPDTLTARAIPVVLRRCRPFSR